MDNDTRGTCLCKQSPSLTFRLFTPDWEHVNKEDGQVVKTIMFLGDF